MKPCDTPVARLLRSMHALVVALAASAALAGAGFHGPDGQHLNEQAPKNADTAASPRLEAHTELFELVGVLGAGELSLMIDRFESNEPVLDAQVQVQTLTARAVAAFHADHGDYSVTDPELLQTLSQPGQHPVVITVTTATGVSDLLDVTLDVPASGAIPATSLPTGLAWWLGPGLAAALLAAGAWLILKRRATRRTGKAGA